MDTTTLADRTEAAEVALRNAALTRPNALALIEAGVARIGEALGAAVGVALVGDGHTGDFVRCAVWPPTASPDLVESCVADVPSLGATRPTIADGDLAWCLSQPHGLVVPVEGSVPGAFVLGRRERFCDDDLAAASRLAALFSTVWAWSESEARFQRTVSDLDDALITFGHSDDGRRVYVQVAPQAEAITGLDPDAILAGDADWADLVVADDVAAFQAHEQRLRSGERSRVKVRLRLDGGDVVWISERATPSVDAAGRPISGGLLSDVTDQKEAEAKLDRARHLAERAAQTRMAFLRLMSHELRTPLGTIRGFADLLVSETKDLAEVPPEVGEFSATIRDASGRALRLVGDLFDLSRLETGAIDLHSSPVDLSQVARDVADRYAADLDARDVAMSVVADDVVALGDPARVEQVVDQLVSNAARFTPSGMVAVTVGVADGWARLTVRDTGVGIAPDALDAVFEPFVQEDDRVNREYQGTGLGLAIASRLARQMGGTLDAASAKGEGSTFTLSLPAASPLS